MHSHTVVLELLATSVAAEAGQPMNKKRSCRAGVTTRSATSAIRSGETVSVGLLNLADTRLQHYNLYNTMSLSRFRFLFALRFEVSP